MGRALKYIFYIAVLGTLGLAAYAMLADLPPPTKDIVVDIKPPATSEE